MVKTKLFVLAFFVLVLASFTVFAGQYNQCRYNLGVFGQGEDCGGSTSVSSGGGGGGSSSSSTVSDGGNATISLAVPNDLLGDVSESSVKLACLSNTCTVTATEVNNLPDEIASVYKNAGGDFVSAVRLQCVGDIGSGTADFLIDLIEGVDCSGLKISIVEEDGSSNEATVECTMNNDGSLDVEASFSGCGYLVVWNLAEEVEPTVASLEGTEEEVVPQVEEVQSAARSGGAGVWILILVLAVLGAVVYTVLKKRKNRKF